MSIYFYGNDLLIHYMYIISSKYSLIIHITIYLRLKKKLVYISDI